jgi:DNA-binding XRE family transcriptional regulator
METNNKGINMNRLKEFRERAGLSRKELADLVGMSDTAIRKIENGIENGGYYGPTLANARKIVIALKKHKAFKGYRCVALDLVFPIDEIADEWPFDGGDR